jgi:CheY-like chemotaxis protein
MSETPIMDGSARKAAPRRQCLFGVTIMLVEDSRSASEAVRLYAAESGARLRRAESMTAALRHLAIYRPHVLIVDLGLPDGDGLELIRQLATSRPPFQRIIATSGHEPSSWVAAAREAGAATCLEKPVAGLAAFQDCVLSLLPDRADEQASDADLSADAAAALLSAYEADLRRAHTMLVEAEASGDIETITYCAQFLGSVSGTYGDGALALAARELASGCVTGPADPVDLVALIELLRGRLEASRDGLRGAA